MGVYTKNIAVIKGLKDGFSSDGSPLTGLVKAERYGGSLRVQVSYINFAPLSEGRYIAALSDGNTTVIVENGLFEGASALDTSAGFAALICHVNGQVNPIAAAICGNYRGAALAIKEEVERAEHIRQDGAKPPAPPAQYEDEAIAEENYYEYAKASEDRGAVRQDTQKEEDGREFRQDEAAFGSLKEEQDGIARLARGDFYARMQREIEGLFAAYPAEESLQRTVEGSRWVRISYGEGKFYVFGVIYSDGKPRYLCYGVPAASHKKPPESMAGLASFIPSSPQEDRGFWVMYQDADTGASLKIEAE